MYAALWRVLPGPAPVRVLCCLALAAAVVVGCFLWVFPWIAAHLPVNDPTVGGLWTRSPDSVTAVLAGLTTCGGGALV
jgi:hypothetical protein